MRVLFLGTPAFAVPTLHRLVQSKQTVAAVVTQPDRPRGRGQKVESPPAKEAARAAGLPILQPKDPSAPEFLRTVRMASPDCALVVAYGRLLSPSFLELFPKGVYNLHGSLLPKYRGAAPIQWALIRGEKETGVTVFHLDEQLDHGPALLRRTLSIAPEEDAVSLAHRLAELGADAVLEALDRIAAGTASLEPQQEALATLAPRLTKEAGRIDWSCSSEEIHNLVRGVQPWPGAFTTLEGKLLKILAVTTNPNQPFVLRQAQHERPSPGTVLSADPSAGLWVQTGSGLLRILRLQPEAGKPLDAADYLRGHPIPLGTRLTN